jgi:hypothetical protein
VGEARGWCRACGEARQRDNDLRQTVLERQVSDSAGSHIRMVQRRWQTSHITSGGQWWPSPVIGIGGLTAGCREGICRPDRRRQGKSQSEMGYADTLQRSLFFGDNVCATCSVHENKWANKTRRHSSLSTSIQNSSLNSSLEKVEYVELKRWINSKVKFNTPSISKLLSPLIFKIIFNHSSYSKYLKIYYKFYYNLFYNKK